MSLDDEHWTRDELIQELQQLRQRLANLERAAGARSDPDSLIDVLTKYQLLAAVARDVLLFIRARDGRILEANRAAEETYGYSRTELLNLTIYDLRALTTQTSIAGQMNQADLQGITFETQHRRRDGREFPVEVNSGGITIGNERVLLSIVRDIAERKRAEADIQSLAKFPAENPNPVLRIDRDGRLLYANDASYALLSDWPLAEGQSAPAVLRVIVAETLAAQTSKIVDMEHDHRVISFFVAPVVEAGYANLYGRDITAHKQSESALRQSEELFSQSFFNAPVALCLTRAVDGRFFEVNDRFLALLEYSRADVIGHTTLELKMYPDPSERAMLVDQLRMHGFVREHELTVRTCSGALRQVLLSSVTVKLNHEDSILATLIDVTERKQMETALQELNATLEERVQARTAELQIATNRLLELDRLKDDFISRINHELRTPLSIVQLHTELLRTGPLDKRDQYLHILRRETQRLRILIEDLLKINQLTSDLIEPESRSTDLNQLIAPHLPAWRDLATQRGLKFTTDLAADLPLAFIDPELITQVIAQLLHNAVNYTAQGTIVLCTVKREHEQRIWITVSVSDTGPGIAPDELPHIFERFYRGRAAANYKTPGTGVGLSISRDIVSLLGGQITVESEFDRGSLFTLWLPLAPVE